MNLIKYAQQKTVFEISFFKIFLLSFLYIIFTDFLLNYFLIFRYIRIKQTKNYEVTFDIATKFPNI